LDDNTPFSDIYLSKKELKTLKSFLTTSTQEYSDKYKSLLTYGFVKDKGKIVNGYDLSSGILIITQRGKNYIKYRNNQFHSSLILVATLLFSILAAKEELLWLLEKVMLLLP